MANINQIEINGVTYDIEDAGARASLATEYSASSTYAVGDYVLYNGQLYRCNTAIATAEAWTAAHWTSAKIANEVADLKSALNNINIYAEKAEENLRWPRKYLQVENGHSYYIRVLAVIGQSGYDVMAINDNGGSIVSGMTIGTVYRFTVTDSSTLHLFVRYDSTPSVTPIFVYELADVNDDKSFIKLSNEVNSLESALDYRVLYATNTNIINETKQSICNGSCDDVPVNKIYGVSGDCDLTNAPFTGGHYVIITLDKSSNESKTNGSLQIAILSSTGEIKTRNYTNNSWLQWKTLLKEDILPYLLNATKINITESNKQTICNGTCDSIENNKIYGIDGNAVVTNKPFDNYTIIIAIGKNSIRTNGDIQIAWQCTSNKDIVYRVYDNGIWSNWMGFYENAFRENLSLLNPSDKDIYLLNYSVEDGVYEGTTQQYITGNVVYKHSEYTLNGEKIIYIGGYAYSNNYLAWYLLDSNNNIIANYSRYGDYNESHSVIDRIIIPQNATKLIVNFRWETDTTKSSNPMFLCSYNDQEISLADIRTSLKDMGGEIVFGKAMRTNKTEAENSVHVYRKIPVSGGEELYITGWQYSQNFPYMLIYDNNDNIIYIPSDGTTGEGVYNKRVHIPTTARKVVINGRFDQKFLPKALKVTNKITSATSIANANILEKKIELISVIPTVSYGYVKNKNGTLSDHNDVYVLCESSVVGGETYYVSGYHTTDNWPLYLFETSDGKICETALGTEYSNDTKYFDVKVVAPLDAVKIYVNARTVSDFDVKTEQNIALIDTLKNSCSVGIYTGRTPVKKIIGDYTNGEWVANSSKAERNLSKFSYAYAIMLHRIMTTYPFATVICCSCNECERKLFELGAPERNEYGETIGDYNKVIEELCKAFGVLFVDHHSCGITYYNFENYVCDYNQSTGFGLHPNAAGMELIAQKTISDLYGMNFTGKKLSVFGDSISTYNGTGSEHNMYPYGDIQSVDKMWWHISCIQHFGMTLLNNGSGGSRSVSTIREGIATYPKSGCNQDAIDNLAVNGTSPDVIIIKQGINDFGNTGSSTNKDLNGKYWFGGL